MPVKAPVVVALPKSGVTQGSRLRAYEGSTSYALHGAADDAVLLVVAARAIKGSSTSSSSSSSSSRTWYQSSS